MSVKVKDVMNPDVVTIEATAPLMDALELMFEKSVKSLIIPPRDESDAFGILTLTDIAKKAIARDERLEMLNVYDLMSKPCIGVNEDLGVRLAAKLLTDFNISRAVVTDGKSLRGIVSITDLVRSMLKK